MNDLLIAIQQVESVFFILGMMFVQIGVFYWIQGRTDKQSRKNYLKALRRKTENLIK